MQTNPNGYGARPGEYVAHRTPGAIAADGRALSAAWATAQRTRRFVDLVTGEPATLDTTASILWDDENLYIAFWADEPNVVATMTERDDLLFFENDLEIFIDGGDSYYELEFNALGVRYEVFYLWRDSVTPGSKWDSPRFDVHDPRVHSFGGDHPLDRASFWTGNHPRGTRWAYLNYDLPGVQVAVSVQGSINDPTVVDTGWTAEVTIPWASLGDLANGRSLPPSDGEVWGIFLGRFEQVATRGPGTTATAGWGASPIGVADTHVPESFTQVRFAAAASAKLER
jgi:Carbohydrate family 9 binding domain-like